MQTIKSPILRASFWMPVTFLTLVACVSTPDPRHLLCSASAVEIYADYDTAGRHTCDVTAANAITLGVEHEAALDGPINPSPWYSVEFDTPSPTALSITLDYFDYKHRYAPDLILSNGKRELVETVEVSEDGHRVTFNVALPAGRSKLVAEPTRTTTEVLDWMETIAASTPLKIVQYGTSADGRTLHALVGGGRTAEKVVIGITRQHPPEISGATAFEAYVETMALNADFSSTRFVLFPLPNPDGIADGNWRHTSAGRDMNRDWFALNLVETKAAAGLILKEADGRIPISMLDFHSTHRTLVYSHMLEDTDPRMCLPKHLESVLADDMSPPPEWIPGHNDSKGTFKNWALQELDVAGLTIELEDAPPEGVAEQVGMRIAEEILRIIASDECRTY